MVSPGSVLYRFVALTPYCLKMLAYELTAKDLAAKLKHTPELKVVDVREPWEFATAHIAGSTLIPMGEIPARANTELDPDEPIVVLCHAGVRSMNVTVWLREQGFEKAQSLRGGIDAWSREVDPAVPRY